MTKKGGVCRPSFAPLGHYFTPPNTDKGALTMSDEKKLPRIEIIEKYCKGCHICVEFCPTKVLEMKGFVVSVKDLSKCIKCMQCELRCPDFAIKVHAE